MKAQVNLLPSIKQERLNARRTHHLIIGSGVAILAIAVVVPILLLLVRSGQSLALKRTQNSINDRLQTIQNTEDITTKITVKEHLASLPALYQTRVQMSELFKLLPSVTPTDVRLNSLEAGADGAISFIGTSSSYSSVQKFYTALSQANVKVDPNRVNPELYGNAHFKDLLLENVGGNSGDEVEFTIRGQFALDIITGENHGQ